MYKLLVFDIDDTLTKKAKEIPVENLLAIRRAQEVGIFVTVATGRGYWGSSPIWKQIGIKGPVINYGGAVIYDTRTDEPIYETSIEPSLVVELLELARQKGIHAQLYQGDTVVFETENAFSKKYTSMLDLPFVVDRDIRFKRWDDVPKVLFIVEPGNEDGLISELSEMYSGILKVSASRPGYIELNDIFAHKGSAVAYLAEQMEIKREEVAAMGDNMLDFEMIEWAGLGVAVADAHERVLEIADIITPTCEDFGAAWLIDNILLKEKRY